MRIIFYNEWRAFLRNRLFLFFISFFMILLFIVTFFGIAQNNKELNKVIKHASNIAGVKKIVNLIELKDLKDE